MGHNWSEEAKARGTRKLSPELINAICEIIAGGNYARVACRTMGVPYSTFYDWRKRGVVEPDTLYGTFRAALELAEAERETKLVEDWKAACRDAKHPDWRGPAHMLARLHPSRWSESGAGDDAEEAAALFHIDQDALLERLTDDELRTLMALLRKAGGIGRGEGAGAAPLVGFRGDSLPGVPRQLAQPPAGKKT